MTVPGGPRPVCAVTGVAVMPSHRRRGILSALMRRQLADLHENGEATAVLYASEAGIYGRFGYGRAVDNMFFRIPKRGSEFVAHAPSDPALRVRVVRPDAARADLEKVFDAVVTTRPGLYVRSAARWDLLLTDDEHSRHGAGSLRCVVVEDDAGPRGYALFRIKPDTTDHDVPDGEVRLVDLFGLDPAAYALLCASAFHHYDVVYRLRQRGEEPPAWLTAVGLGWDGRLLAVAALVALDLAPEGLWVLAAALGGLYATEAAASWAAFGRTQIASSYADEEEDEE